MNRERLPNRRPSVTETVILANGAAVHVSAGFAPDGRLLEVFLRSGKAGSDSDHLADDIAVTVSRLLQHGDLVSDIARGIGRLPDGGPASVVGAVVDKLVEIEADIRGGASGSVPLATGQA